MNAIHRTVLLLSWFLGFSLPLFGEETGRLSTAVEVMVAGDRVNLRTRPNLNSDVIGQADYGDMLQAVELREEWVRVRAPEELVFWVHGGMLFEEREVRIPVLNVRSGPGTQFPVTGQLERGEPVEVVREHGEWRHIVTPDAVTLWISREFVQVPEQLPVGEEDAGETVEAEEEEERPEAGEEDVEEKTDAEEELEVEDEADVVIVEERVRVEEVEEVEEEEEEPVRAEPTPRVEVPEGVRDLVPLEGQGTRSVRRGRVRAYLLAGSSPSRFQLVHRGEDGEEITLSYLLGEEERLREVAGKEVRVRGRDFWVTGRRLPVTRVELIDPLPAEGE